MSSSLYSMLARGASPFLLNIHMLSMHCLSRECLTCYVRFRYGRFCEEYCKQSGDVQPTRELFQLRHRVSSVSPFEIQTHEHDLVDKLTNFIDYIVDVIIINNSFIVRNAIKMQFQRSTCDRSSCIHRRARFKAKRHNDYKECVYSK
jgi:hypothetical protein